MFGIMTLVEVCGRLLAGLGAAPSMRPDVRTIRYYGTMGLLASPRKVGRQNGYDSSHVKQVLSIKILQARGLSLSEIRARMDDPDRALLEVGVPEEALEDAIAALAPDEPIPQRMTYEDKKAYLAIGEGFVKIGSAKDPQRAAERLGLKLLCVIDGGKGREKELRARFASDNLSRDTFRPSNEILRFARSIAGEINQEPQREGRKEETAMPAKQKPTIEVSNYQVFQKISKKAYLGASFLFLKGLDESEGLQVHKLLHGQLKKAKHVRDAVLFVDERLEMPGFALVGGDMGVPVAVVCADKDVYREGTDVARVFLFRPGHGGEKVEVITKLGGAELERNQVDLDVNGCALVRVPVLVAGQYEVKVASWDKSCSFEAGRYELAPLVITVGEVVQDGDGIKAKLAGERLGAPLNGVAIATVMDGETPAIEDVEIRFSDGEAGIEFDAKALKDSIRLDFYLYEDPGIVASAPIRGSKVEEREDEVVSRMGRVVAASLIPAERSQCSHGLFFSDKQQVNNAPVALASCVGEKAVLTFRKAVQRAVVVVRNLLTGEFEVKDLGKVKGNSRKSVPLAGAFSSVHVGCLDGDMAWEGNAIVALPQREAKVRTDAEVLPGGTLRVRLSSPWREVTSVLVKVLDKRTRPQYEPMVAAASSIKSWLKARPWWAEAGEVAATIEGVAVGFTGIPGPTGHHGISVYSGYSGASGFRGRQHGQFTSTIGREAGPNRRWLVGGSVLRAQGFGARGLMASSPRSGPDTLYSIGHEPAVNHLFTKSAPAFGDVYSASSLDMPVAAAAVDHVYFAGEVARAAVPHTVDREASVDLIFCDLVRFEGSKELFIGVPDVVADLEVRAFAACGADWSEVVSSARATKPVYIEPMIPQVAHPEDGVRCRAFVVHGDGRSPVCTVKVDGRAVEFDAEERDGVVELSWPAVPGVHRVATVAEKGGDAITRVIEAPGEEAVLTQELRVLARGESFDIEQDEGALSVSVVRGVEAEAKKAIHVVTSFGHLCCEQTAAQVLAAALAIANGDDQSREAGLKAIVLGEARLRSMYRAGAGFHYYPEYGSVNNWASAIAARRATGASALLAGLDLPGDARKAVDGLRELGRLVTACHGDGAVAGGKFERAFFGGYEPSAEDAREAREAFAGQPHHGGLMTEVAYMVARGLRDGAMPATEALALANEVARAAGVAMGGGMHGTCETLAYAVMMSQLAASGLLSGSRGGVVVNGKAMRVDEATGLSDVVAVEARDNPVAIRVSRLSKIRFDEFAADLPFDVSLEGNPTEGARLRLVARLGGEYKAGDVLCVSLPDCVSRVVSGVKQKKFELDFAGRVEVSAELVAHGATGRPQRWHAVVRNMYDSRRIGSMGTMATSVSSR